MSEVDIHSDDYDYIFKLVLVGDSGVGKSCLLKRYQSNEFSSDNKPTIGVEFIAKRIEMPADTKNKEGKIVKAQIWDTAGQERFRAITSAYYRGALGAIICYDISKRKTFDNISLWLSEMRNNCEPVSVMLVGTKTDLAHLREVTTEEAVRLAEQENLLFLETSAQSSVNVELAFEDVVRRIYHQVHKELEDNDKATHNQIPGRRASILPTSVPENSKKENCCK
eukprot:TRINITY_DN6319_c0_g1_i1.p1 TRINITY_DN6319_c0_g1~~TRINITY_DN6319_c0_g1_i1.p1  ORF type:complete len:224 (+),score=40.93 TRINITY_DN6319_c0_g1_i1:160-831(+)